MPFSPAVAQILAYHERTKHRFDGYAKGPETIDWDAQPDSFRRFEEAPKTELPLCDIENGPSYASLYDQPVPNPAPWSKQKLSQLLQFSLALSAWKQYGTSRWSLRCNPSSGNLHPTECYLILIGIDGFDDGLYHYRADRHGLELRCRFPAERQSNEPLLLLGLSSVHWREAWKYGERAYRYCQLDIGHAMAAVDYSARLLGYRATPMLEIGSQVLQQLLGLDRNDEFFSDEAESADLLLALLPSTESPTLPVDALLNAVTEGHWHGRANRLDPEHLYSWPIIDAVAEATQRPSGERDQTIDKPLPDPLPPSDQALSTQNARKLLRQRRSAQAFDAKAQMSRDDFFRLLDRTLARQELPPWSARNWPHRLHLVLFVHAVEDVAPGLYLLDRTGAGAEQLQARMNEQFIWEPVDGAPCHLPLYCLIRARARQTAMHVSCHQDIAGDSVFALSMLAEFEPIITPAPWRYPELFWEAGMIGQVLYLEAEAIGLRGTGIGCFFDDAIHQMLGLRNNDLQSVYSFTVGAPINDPRLATLPPYPTD
jgi:SagB-type dehydrogenase family enzyme